MNQKRAVIVCIAEYLTELTPREMQERFNAGTWVLEEQHRLAISTLIRDLLDLE
ncbi:hypothetical protein [Methanoregula sp.]|uniref:hypothetical protein n=1 Tax=Methanoregula sp. TaxID=2052170 RepID=UPI00236F44BB|nr:hypothetical protein [Methanoregula sp.]MDD1686032.1 hypothetical protein [Methanoregula sp.]